MSDKPGMGIRTFVQSNRDRWGAVVDELHRASLRTPKGAAVLTIRVFVRDGELEAYSVPSVSRWRATLTEWRDGIMGEGGSADGE